MTVNTYAKNSVIKEFQLHRKDFGSADVQIGMLTERTLVLEEALVKKPNDYGLRLLLIRVVSERRKLIEYLKSCNFKRYLEVIKKLDIKK